MDDSYEATTHSFLVRIWLEELDESRATWRGHITHVSDGTRSYIKELDDVSEFLGHYLQKMGVSLPLTSTEKDE